MRYKSPEMKNKIKNFIEDYYCNHNTSPSMQAIADFVGLAKSSVFRYITEMADEGMITYSGDTISTGKIVKHTPGQSYAGIVGSIPCGTPAQEEEYVEEYIPLPKRIIGNGDFFILRASGDSMINAGIDNGDLVFIRKQNTAEDGEIVAALVNGTDSTLKRLLSKNGEMILHPENPNMEDIVPETGLDIQGVAIFVLKQIGRIL